MNLGEARVKPGSLYQNEYMTLWNDSNDPVSAVLYLDWVQEGLNGLGRLWVITRLIENQYRNLLRTD